MNLAIFKFSKSFFISFLIILFNLSYLIALNNPPALIRSIDLSTINENLPVNSYVFQLIAHDPENTPVSFELDGTDLLRVDRRTGIVYVAKPIDREKTGEQIEFSVILQDQVPVNSKIVNDQPDEANIVNIPVKVFVVDENDNSPAFIKTETNITIPEDTQPGTAVLSELIANDADTVGSILKASCDGCGSLFHIQNLFTPTISLIRFSLILTQHIEFRLRSNIHNLTLHVTDGIHNTSLRLTIVIKDVQNRPPVFIGSKEISLLENVPVNTIVYNVRAIDGDALNDEQLISLSEKSVNLQFMNTGRKLAYFLEENPGDCFSLDQRNGELRIANSLDREAAFINTKDNDEISETKIVVKIKAVEIFDENGQLDEQEVSTARAELIIKLIDVNDEKPTFDKEQYSVTIKEDHPSGKVLNPSLVIYAKDRDLGLNSLFRVRLLEAGSELFQIEPTVIENNGQMTIRLKENITLDYENVNQRRFNLLLEAKELKTKEKFSSTARLLINVQDINDNKPEFSFSSYLINLIEDSQPGTTIKSIQATDRDSPLLTRLSYELRGENANLFDLDSKTGVIRVSSCPTPSVAPCLDFEKKKFYNFTYTAYDGFGMDTSVPLRVQLLDANDNVPQFEYSIYEIELEENSNHFDKPFFVRATDLDISSTLKYSIINEKNEITENISDAIDNFDDSDDTSNRNSNKNDFKDLLGSSSYMDMLEVPVTLLSLDTPDLNAFENDKNKNYGTNKQFFIDSVTGEIKVNKPIGYTEKPITLTVKVSDGLHNSHCKVKISIRDINDNSPTFDKLTYYVNVSEIADIGSIVTKVHATDGDIGLNSKIIYTMIYTDNLKDDFFNKNLSSQSSQHDDFVINNSTGVVYVKNSLDFDRFNLYIFKIKAEDFGEPKRSSIATLIINVLNENNKNPYFKPSTQMTEVNEHVNVGTRIYKLVAEDPDLLVYKKSNRHYNLHNQRTAKQIYSYRDSIDINDSSNQNDDYLPNIKEEEILIYRIENFVALNKDGGQIEPNSQAMNEVSRFFAIDSNGYLIVSSPLHYELAALVTLNVSVIDSSASYPQIGYGILIVKIIDYNDNPPIFNEPWSILNPRIQFEMTEEQPIGTIVGQLQANDIDTEIDYFKISPPSKYFSINNKTGVIKLSKTLDYETISFDELKFNVVVYDTGLPQLHANCYVDIKLININDNNPVFSHKDYNVTIQENLTWGSFVLQVNATDKDKGVYGKIKYSIVDSRDKKNKAEEHMPGSNKLYTQDVYRFFRIDEDTGVIRVVQGANLDREAGLKEIHFQVSAVDNPSNFNSNLLQPSETGSIGVLDEPSVNKNNNLHSSLETINSPNTEDLYSEETNIDETIKKTIVYANVHVKILDVNDNPPIFKQHQHTVKIYDYSDINSEYNFYSNYFSNPRDELRNFVLQLNATDEDEGLNGLIKYRILSGNQNNVFELDEITGKLFASKTPLKINKDTSSYRIEIEARDQNGLGKLSDKVQIVVTIHRVNKYKPKFLFPLGSKKGFASHNTLSSINDNVVTVLENQPINTVVAEIKAEDLDPGKNGIISFSFKINSTQNSQETELFKLDQVTGLITTKVVFDREQQSEYRVMLSASDSLAEPQSFETLQELIIRIEDLEDNTPEFPRRNDPTIEIKNNLKKPFEIDESSFLDNSLTSIDLNKDFDENNYYTYIFKVSENLPGNTVIGKIQAIDKDEKPEYKKIYYHIIDGNDNNIFHINPNTGLLQANKPLDREQQAHYQLIIKAASVKNFTVPKLTQVINYKNLTYKFEIERQRSFVFSDKSLAIVKIDVLDLNDNEPLFEKKLYRVAVSHQSKLNDTLLFMKAKDPDNEVNASLIYSIAYIDMFRKYIDDLENPVRPIPSPFGIDQNTGRLSLIHSINQYPIQTRFVIHAEARERSSPFRIAKSLVHVYVYDPSKLIKITIKLKPSLVEQQQDNIEQLLSENLENTHLKALITSIKYHLDVRRGRVVHEYTDCFVLVIDERNLGDISPEKMISKLDSNAAKLIFAHDAASYQDDKLGNDLNHQQHYSIEQITLASSIMNTGPFQPFFYNFKNQFSGDMQTIIFFILIVLIIIGFVSMAVSCCCLKSWYYQKLIERAQLAQQKNLFNVGATLANTNGFHGPLNSGKYASSFLAEQFNSNDPIDEQLYAQSIHNYPLAYSCLNANGSINGITDTNGSMKRPRSKNSTLRQQIPNENGRMIAKDNWLDGNEKYFEDQEQSVQVATMDLSKDNDSVNYYTFKNTNKNRQRLPANNQEIPRKVNDYHELKNSSDTGQSSDN